VLQAQIQAQELANYEADKAGQRLWTAALSAIGVAATYSVYGREVCASYLVGALGGIFYLRLLGKSVDKYGGQVNILDGASSALGNQRLLIPVILALGYNRCVLACVTAIRTAVLSCCMHLNSCLLSSPYLGACLSSHPVPRWNELYADEYGLRLNLLAMLVGFLTYKVAVIARQAKQVWTTTTGRTTRPSAALLR
jgi:ATP synthase protein I